METDQSDAAHARRQLEELDGAVRASTAAGLQPLPIWFPPLFALLGPAIVGTTVARSDTMEREYSASAVDLLLYSSLGIGLIALVAMVVGWIRERQDAVVRGKPPIRGGKTTIWMFASVFSVTFGLLMTAQLVPPVDENPLILAIVSYLWLATVPWILWTRHVKAMTER